MYTRSQPEKEKIQVPQNYGGNAFRDNVYTDIGAEEREPEAQPVLAPSIPCDVPRLSPPSPRENSSSLSSLLPNLLQKNHFPFGHGIGSEELFILGIMLLIYMSGEQGEVDNELLLLLCVLLFSG